jgi:hypothetical protein
MTAGRFRITVAGLIGSTLKSAFAELAAEEVARHHVLVVPGDGPDVLFPVLHHLDEQGVEVEQVIARYR